MKRNMKWKLCSVLTVFALMAAMIAMPVKAGTGSGGTIEVSSYDQLKTAFESVGGASIKLMENITFPDNKEGIIKLEEGTFTLDLNGKQINQGGDVKTVGAPISLYGATLTIEDSVGSGEINATQTGVGVFKNSTFILNGGKLQGGWYGLAGNGRQQDTNITINGGRIISEDPTGSAFYHPQRGNLTINGGFIKGATGVQLCSGAGMISANFSGGTIHGFGEDSREDKTGDGVVTDGAAISIVNRNYPGGAPSITINGGTFTADQQDAVLAYTWTENEKGDWAAANEHVILKGGTYSSDVANYVPNTHKVQTVNDKFVVYPKVTGVTLNKSVAQLETGKTMQLTATLAPEATLETVKWTSDKTSVATVDATGKVTGVSAGKAKITATADGKVATCEVQVYKIEKPVLPTPPVNNGKDTTIEVNEKTTEVLTDTIKEIVSNVEAAKGVSPETKAALKEAIAAGKQISVEAKTEKVDAKKVETTVVKEVEKVIAKDAMIAQYFDLSMMIKAGGTDLGTMNELSSKASFTVSVPTDLTKEGRTFYMVRIHNGVAEKIAGTLKGNEFTFESDKFSLFALVYEDAKPADTGDKEETVDKVETEDKKDTTVDTGDTTDTTSLLVMIGAASLILGGLLLRKRLEK